VDNVRSEPAKAVAFFDAAPPRSSLAEIILEFSATFGCSKLLKELLRQQQFFRYPHSWSLAGVGNWRGSAAARRILTAKAPTAKTEDAAGYEGRRA
jgi:hypothetical protein